MPSVRRRRDLCFFNEVSGLVRCELSFLALCVCPAPRVWGARCASSPSSSQASESSGGFVLATLAAAKVEDIFIHLSVVNSSRRVRTELLDRKTGVVPLKLVCLCNARAIICAIARQSVLVQL